VAVDIDTLYCAKEGDRLAADDKPNSTVLVYRNRETKPWSRIKPSVAWTAIGMASFVDSSMGQVVFAVSPYGKVLQLATSSEQLSVVEIPNPGASLRTARTIAETAWVVGMGRRAFKRSTDGLWTEDSPTPRSDDGTTIIGFEDIDGFGSDDIYAVGWKGEIWHRSTGRWRQIDSPTSRNLNAVCCASDGSVYAVGQKGTLLVGRGDSWATVDAKLKRNLLDVTEFDGVVLVCTDHAILKLQNDQLVPEDRFADDRRPATCLHLVRTTGGVYAVGPKDVFRLQGDVWRQVV
jgi:hypothetical protein